MAGEANSPGSFSKRAVNFLSTLDKSDAELFTRLCGFLWNIGTITPLVYDLTHDVYKLHGMTFSNLSHLDTIGLVQFNHVAAFSRTGLPRRFTTSYYDMKLELELPNQTDNTLQLGEVMLTNVGHQLAPIAGGEPVKGFFNYVREKWKALNYIN